MPAFVAKRSCMDYFRIRNILKATPSLPDAVQQTIDIANFCGAAQHLLNTHQSTALDTKFFYMGYDRLVMRDTERKSKIVTQ